MGWLNRASLVLLISLGLLVIATSASAHPHVWIDLRIKPVMNEQGQLLGLEQAWRFDPFYSLVLIEELERGGPKAELETRYDQLVIEIVNTLKGVNFFTQGQSNGLKVSWLAVTEHTLLRVGQRLEFRFLLSLAKPLALDQQPFSYQIYDPTYYIEMLHSVTGGLDKSALMVGCSIKLTAPSPSSDLIEKALALDKNEVAEDPQLGSYFAEQTTLSCLQ